MVGAPGPTNCAAGVRRNVESRIRNHPTPTRTRSQPRGHAWGAPPEAERAGVRHQLVPPAEHRIQTHLGDRANEHQAIQSSQSAYEGGQYYEQQRPNICTRRHPNRKDSQRSGHRHSPPQNGGNSNFSQAIIRVRRVPRSSKIPAAIDGVQNEG